MSAVNRAEGRRHVFAAAILSRLGRRLLVPWPVLTEVDLVLRARGHAGAASAFTRSLADGIHRLEAPTDSELELCLDLAERYPRSGADLPDLTVMAMAAHREAAVLTWDFRHFHSVVLRKGHHWQLLVDAADLPAP